MQTPLDERLWVLRQGRDEARIRLYVLICTHIVHVRRIGSRLGCNPEERTGEWDDERPNGRFVRALDEVSDRIGRVLALFVASRGETCDNDGHSRRYALGQTGPEHHPSWDACAFDSPAKRKNQRLQFVLGHRLDERVKHFPCRGMNVDLEIVK